MSAVAVVAHSGKTLDGGLPALRKSLERQGVDDMLWYEVPKSRKAPKEVARALAEGADLVFVWGGDGMVQRCVGVLADSKATMAIVPAGTANLLASNLGIPKSIDGAVEMGLHGPRQKLDLGRMNGERFAVMAGAGFDAAVIKAASAEKKAKLGRMAYVWAASKNLHGKPFHAEVDVDGANWYEGPASCILLGNVGHIFGGIEAFENAKPDDGLLDIGVASPEGIVQWGRMIVRSAASHASKSPFVHMTQGRLVEVTMDRKVLYELDGGARVKTKAFRVDVEPGAVRICRPEAKK